MRIAPKKLRGGEVSIPLSQKAVAGVDLHRQLRDPSFQPDEIVENRHTRDNLETFAGRRFVSMSPEHVRRFEALAIRHGPETTHGELANVIDPTCPARGAAVIQGLTVRRRVEIDLRALLTSRTPVRIH